MIKGLGYYEDKFQVKSEQAIKPGLASMEKALRKLGNPERSTRFVHLAGTNGKGSTLTYVEALAMEHGMKVGSFLSPAIETVHDQLRLNGQAITKQQMEQVFERLQQANISSMCTEFELLTCAAFVFFEQQQVDIAVVEAGMGGRFDSTNVLQPLVSIIPSIALEHTNFLGDTIEKIAYHKAGIIKHDAPVVVGPVDMEALRVIKEQAVETNSQVDVLGETFSIVDTHYSDATYRIPNIEPGMLGQHQVQNAALAIRAFSYIKKLDVQRVQRAIQRAKLPFRFERITNTLYFDGAHNPASARTLVKTIEQQFPNKEIHFVVGMLADKDVNRVLCTLETVSEHFVFVDVDNVRAMPAEQLYKRSKAKQKQVEIEIVPYLVQQVSNPDHITIVTGSLYLLATIRAQILQQLK